MKDIYEEWRSYENASVILRPIVMEDAGELLKVYSDKEARPLFNCDNFSELCYFDTLEQMQKEILFYIDSYRNRYFVRWTIISKSDQMIAGSIEIFHRNITKQDGTPWDAFSNTALLRIDLRSDFEKVDFIIDLLKLIQSHTYKDFHCDEIATKAVKEARERRNALNKMGFVESLDVLIGHHGEQYNSYFIRKKGDNNA